MTALSQLTAVQADAVVATGGLCLRDPEELAVDLFPLLHINPFAESSEAAAMAVSDALTTEIPVVESTVNETLTPEEHTS